MRIDLEKAGLAPAFCFTFPAMPLPAAAIFRV